MKLELLINPSAACGKKGKWVDKIENYFIKEGFKVQKYISKDANDLYMHANKSKNKLH